MKNKRGELTSSQIVALIIAIAGFTIVLIVLFTVLDLKNQTEEEICRLSVLTRATSPEAAQEFIPLKCKTKKLCLSTEGKTCNQFNGEKPEPTISVSKNIESGSEKIEETLANAMYDCWSMMGKGKLDLFGKTPSISDFLNLNKNKATCVICSRIALAQDLKDNEKIRKNVNLNEYLQKEQVPGSTNTYLQEFTDKQIKDYPSNIVQEFTKEKNQKPGTDQIAILFAQIKSAETPEEAFKSGALAGAGFLFGGTYAMGVTGKLVTSNPLLTGTAAAIAIVGTGGLKAYGAAEAQDISAAYCGKFTSSEKNKYGCSIVTQADYNNLKTLNSLCGKIEGQL